MGYPVPAAFVKARKNRSPRASRVWKILPMIKPRCVAFLWFLSLFFREPVNRLPLGCSRSRRAARLGLLLGVWLCAATSVAVATPVDDAVVIRSVAVGIGGWTKVGKWTRVQVTVECGVTGSVTLFLTTTDPVGRAATFESRAVDVATAGEVLLVGWFQSGRLGGKLDVAVAVNDKVVQRSSVVLGSAPQRPVNWRATIGGAAVAAGTDRISIPVRAGQRVVFYNEDRSAHGLVIADGPDRSSAGNASLLTGAAAAVLEQAGGGSGRLGQLVAPARPGEPRAEIVAFEVIAAPKSPIRFHGVATGWALSGQFVAADDATGGTGAGELIEVSISGQPVVLEHSETLWLAWGNPAGLGMTPAERRPDRVTARGRRVVPFDSEHLRLIEARDLDAIDAIVLAAGNGYRIDSHHARVLADWVAAGGHLVVAVGAERDAWLQSRLSQWVPVKAVGDRQLSDSDLRGLETFAARNVRIPFLGRIRASVLELADGRTFSTTLSGPLIGESAYGLGRVTMLAVDLDRQPLANWTALPVLIDRLLLGGANDGRDAETRVRSGSLSHSGISDLKTQLHAIQDDFSRVRRLKIWQVMALIVLFLLVIGPLDFLVVRHLLKRPRMTWVTLPAMIVMAISLSVWIGGRTNGRELLLNQTEIIDLDTVTSRASGQTWATIYAVDSGRFDVEVRPALWPQGRDAEVVQAVSWSGIPEETFGGMYRDGRTESSGSDYRIQTNPLGASIRGLPVAVWSTRTLVARWDAPAAGLVEGRLTSTGVGQLSGELVHRLPGTLDDWLIAFENRVYRPGGQQAVSWRDGARLRLGSSQVKARALKGYLTGTTSRRVARKSGFGTDVRTVQVRYDPLNLDPADLMQILTFHGAAGGTRYTGLSNLDLATLDLSNLLPLDRAILLGRLVSPRAAEKSTAAVGGSDVLINGEEVRGEQRRRLTYVRIILPVTHRARPRKTIVDPSEKDSN